MVACEYAEAAGIERQRIVNAKLRTKVSDGSIGRDLKIVERPADALGHVRLKLLIELSHTFEIDGIGSRFGQPVFGSLREQPPRVLFTFFPNFRIEVAKNSSAVRGPTPPVIPGQPLEGREWCRQCLLLRRTLLHLSRVNHSVSAVHSTRVGRKVGESTRIRGTEETPPSRGGGKTPAEPGRLSDRLLETV